jgi:signal transduction histidine kinase
MRFSVTARIALLSIALALASNLAVLAFVRHQTRAAAMETLRRDTIARAEALAAAAQGGEAAFREAVAEAADPADPSGAVAAYDAGGRRVAGVGPGLLAVRTTPTRFTVATLGDVGAWRGPSGYVLRPVGGEYLLVARHLATVDTQQRSLERALAVGMLVALLFGAAGGLIVSRYVAQRLSRISGVIEAVGEGDLTRRVPLEARGADAFDRHSTRLNRTLDKVEALMGELRLVTDGLAHDLRSPLARLRAKTEQAVLQPEGPGREAALGGLLAECDLIMRMLTTMIEISRAEQVSRDRFVLADPAALVAEIADLYEPLAEDAGFAFTLETEAAPVRLPLHRELLSQAVTNLVDNALKHGAAGGEVTIRLREFGGELAIEVADRGPGIAAEDRAVALRRFGRLDAARSTPGAGLGMALVEAVARLHGGRFELGDARPGLVARIVLPL